MSRDYRPREYVNVWCKILRRTEAAVRIRTDDEAKPVWVPLSQLEYPDQAEPGAKAVPLSMTTWIAEQKDLA